MTLDSTILRAVIINFRTPDLLQRIIQSTRQYYPTLPLLLIDNGSDDESEEIINRLQHQSPANTDVIIHARNMHHGPAMDHALRILNCKYVLFMDSDCEMVKGGFLESMVDRLERDPIAYAAGKRIFMNKRGFDVESADHSYPYIRPICMLIKRELYISLPPFQRHGAPCLENMIAAVDRGLALIDFPVLEYISHAGRGTASRYGYNLGWHGRLNYFLNKIGL